MTGHMLGATGCAEAIFCILALRDNVVPPTINLDNPSDNCDLDFIPQIIEWANAGYTYEYVVGKTIPDYYNFHEKNISQKDILKVAFSSK